MKRWTNPTDYELSEFEKLDTASYERIPYDGEMSRIWRFSESKNAYRSKMAHIQNSLANAPELNGIQGRL